MDGSIVVHPVNSDRSERFSIRTDLSGSKASERMLARDPKKNGPNARRVKRKEKEEKTKRHSKLYYWVVGFEACSERGSGSVMRATRGATRGISG